MSADTVISNLGVGNPDDPEHWETIFDYPAGNWLHAANPRRLYQLDYCVLLATAALKYLYGTKSIGAFGSGRDAGARGVAAFIRQFASEDPDSRLLIYPARAATLGLAVDRKVLAVSSARVSVPETWVYGRDARKVLMPDVVLNDRKRKPAFGSLNGRVKQVWMGRHIANNSCVPKDIMLTSQHDVERYRRGLLPALSFGHILHICRVHADRETGQVSNTRMGIHFDHDGDNVTGLWSTCGDFATCLRNYTPGFGKALARALAVSE